MIEDLTIKEAREIANLCSGSGSTSHSFKVGQKVFVRCVSYHYTGRVKAVTDSDVVLSDAAWIADSGRFSKALRTGELSEVEPYPDDVVLSRAIIGDWCEWTHELPRDVK